MFGIGFPEMILILALALIVVGPDKLPDLARSVAKTIMDLKKTAEGLKENLNVEGNPLSEIRPELEDAAKNFKETILDAETHTWKETSMPQEKNTSSQSLHDTAKTGQPESEIGLDSQIHPVDDIPSQSLEDRGDDSTDTEKPA